jgi:hypothetical protein
MIDASARGVQVFRNAALTLVRHGLSLSLITCLFTANRSRVATRNLTLNITIFTWIGLLYARYDRLIPFSFMILIVLCHWI